MTLFYKFRFAVLLGLLFSFLSMAAHAANPLVKIEGDVSSDIRELLIAVIGEAEAPARSVAQARRRAERASEQARSVMRSQGYYGAAIEARIDEPEIDAGKKRRSPQPVLFITAGTQFVFGSVDVNFTDQTPDVAKETTDKAFISPGKPAIAAEVIAAELRAANFLTANGYPETVILDRDALVNHETKTLQIVFQYQAGDKTRFGEIKQTGTAYLRKTWPQTVAPFKPGDVFSNQKLNTLTTRVIATGVFDGATAVLEDEKTPNADGTVSRNILLNIEQGAINTVSGELGYSTTDGSGVDLTYERRNFIGYAQTLTLKTTLKTNQIKAGVDYNIPYLFREDRSLNLGAEAAREDTEAFTGDRIGANALITQKISKRLKVGLGVGLEASEYEEDGVDVRAYLFDGLGRAAYDSRDNILDPVKGVFIEASATPTYNFGKQDGLFTTAQAGASTYRRLSDTLVAAGRVKAGTIFGANQDSVPLNRRYYGGGGGSVRGFGYQTISPVDADGDYIGGRSLTEVSAELRYRGDSPIGGVAFIDAGSVTANDLPNLKDIRYGAGVGVRYYTSFAPLRADIAIPLNKREGDAAFQVYISIGQAF